MNGKDVKRILSKAGYKPIDIANALGITPQTLNSRFNAKNIKIDFLEELCRATGEKMSLFKEYSLDLDESKGIKDAISEPEIEYYTKHEKAILLRNLDRMTETADRNSRCIEKLVNHLISFGAYSHLIEPQEGAPACNEKKNLSCPYRIRCGGNIISIFCPAFSHKHNALTTEHYKIMKCLTKK